MIVRISISKEKRAVDSEVAKHKVMPMHILLLKSQDSHLNIAFRRLPDPQSLKNICSNMCRINLPKLLSKVSPDYNHRLNYKSS